MSPPWSSTARLSLTINAPKSHDPFDNQRDYDTNAFKLDLPIIREKTVLIWIGDSNVRCNIMFKNYGYTENMGIYYKALILVWYMYV